jgi:ADP-ribosylation factor GTPase-activating protein 1
MDAFKLAEIQRMEHSGNEVWKQFFDQHTLTITTGRTFEDSTIKERYESDVGEEWKARLTAKVEGREYVPVARKPSSSRSSTPPVSGPKSVGNAPARLDRALSRSPAKSESSGISKERNEAYFAKLGKENALRPENILPSQGGKYGGFGGGVVTPSSTGTAEQEESMPGIDDFQKDPVAALAQGFGWFATTVGKGAKTVNDAYLQPAAKSVC